MADAINYNYLMHRAMRGLMIELLEEIAQTGLPGEHHFFITFDTNHPEVEIADWLRERYSEEMTVVIQHWYENLEVLEDGFTVTLNFGDSPEVLVIPWDSVRTFVDPSVEFGLRFEVEDIADDASNENTPVDDESPMIEIEDDESDLRKDADVVSLDSFRKS
ncbi:hypothetical protein GCM10007939_03730 [Amylibacter marinus]|uniref:Stringent starvation protein B n=1 Tax=Amylibacter marinus TaxID=1475483 RepID=A0ABQ5VS13_9RHOB|nr:ClpXP protease specificity-enhancing factor SspB [Amylibacter marinus]GLQ34090.1 hypothetical protein GCM10007939_03730 [Amylibacter marinus]